MKLQNYWPLVVLFILIVVALVFEIQHNRATIQQVDIVYSTQDTPPEITTQTDLYAIPKSEDFVTEWEYAEALAKVSDKYREKYLALMKRDPDTSSDFLNKSHSLFDEARTIRQKVLKQYPAGTLPRNFLISVTYEKPEWLEEHPKQETIEGYIKERKEKITNSAIEYERDPTSRNILPLTLEITIERVVLDVYDSILITEWAHTGGAHRNARMYCYTLRDGKDISISEYLSDRGYSEERLLELVNVSIVRDLKQEHKRIKSIKTFKNGPGRVWQVHAPDSEKPIGIRILFAPGTIEAFAAGTITYTF